MDYQTKQFIVVALIIIVAITLGKYLRSLGKSNTSEHGDGVGLFDKMKLVAKLTPLVHTLASKLKARPNHGFEFHGVDSKLVIDIVVLWYRMIPAEYDPLAIEKNTDRILAGILAVLSGEYGKVTPILELVEIDYQFYYDIISAISASNPKLVTKLQVKCIAKDLNIPE